MTNYAYSVVGEDGTRFDVQRPADGGGYYFACLDGRLINEAHKVADAISWQLDRTAGARSGTAPIDGSAAVGPVQREGGDIGISREPAIAAGGIGVAAILARLRGWI